MSDPTYEDLMAHPQGCSCAFCTTMLVQGLSKVLNIPEATVKLMRTAQEVAAQNPQEVKNVGVMYYTPPSPDKAFVLIPAGLSRGGAVTAIAKNIQDMEGPHGFDFILDAYPQDGAYALYQALQARFGWVQQLGTPGSFFSPSQPPKIYTIDLGDRRVDIPWGEMKIPALEGAYIEVEAALNDGFFKTRVKGLCKKKDKHIIDDLIADAERRVKEESIFRGKAIEISFEELDLKDADNFDPQEMPKFLEPTPDSMNKLVLSREAEQAVNVLIFAPLRFPESCAELGVNPKRTNMLFGPHGTGKTMISHATMWVATQEGRTFILIKDPKDLPQALKFGEMHQPFALFVEDIDRIYSADSELDSSEQKEWSNSLDDITSKGLNGMIIVTTNHPETLPQELLRNGRIDAAIEIGLLDAYGAERLLRQGAGKRLAATTDLSAISKMLIGQKPSACVEVVQRAVLVRLASTGTHLDLQLSEQDLIDAWTTLAGQNRLVAERANAPTKPVVATSEQLEALGRGVVMTLIEKNGAAAQPNGVA